MSEWAIETHHLSRSFGAQEVVSALDLKVPRGVVYGFLGPNGAGKTTTIKMLLGLLKPSRGDIRVLGRTIPLEVREVRKKTGVLLEASGTYDQLSVLDNLRFFAEVYGLPREEVRGRADHLLAQLELSELSNRRVGGLSTGERRKLGIARALLHKPELIFLDEPTAGLDAPSTAALRENLRSLVRQDGLTVFLTTHHLEDAERLCDQVAIIREGRMMAEGSPSVLASRARQPLVTIRGRELEGALEVAAGFPGVKGVRMVEGELLISYQGELDLAELNRRLVLAGIGVEEVVRDQGEFERAFLELVGEG